MGTSGISRFRARAASRPFITGIERSSRIRSGFNFKATLNCLPSVLPYYANFKIRFPAEQFTKPLPNKGIVVRD
jgi:hypothetical protein